jgi:hypothetical protein
VARYALAQTHSRAVDGAVQGDVTFTVRPYPGGDPTPVYPSLSGGAALTPAEQVSDGAGLVGGLYVDGPGLYLIEFATGYREALPAAPPPPEATFVPKTLVDSKGDLIVGTGPDVFERVPVDADGRVLVCDSTQPAGVGWQAAPTQGARASTGAVGASGTASVVVNLPAAFGDTNFTAVASVEDDGGGDTLRVRRITARTAGSVTVLVSNSDALNAQTGTVHVLAVHD